MKKAPRTPGLKKVTGAFVIKIISAAIAFGVNLYVTRLFDISFVSDYFFGYMIFMFSAHLLRLGSDQLVVKECASNELLSVKVCGIIYYCGLLSLLYMALVIPILILLAVNDIIYIFSVLAPIYALISIMSAILKGTQRVNLGLFSQNGMFQTILLLLLFFHYATIGELVNITKVFVPSLAISVLLVFMTCVFLLKEYLRATIKPSWFSNIELREISHFFIVSILPLIQVWFGILCLRYLGSEYEVAVYGVSMRVAVLFGFIYVSISSVLTPHFAVLANKSKTQEIMAIKSKLVLPLTFFAAVLLALVILFGEHILAIFGHEYRAGYFVLVLLCAAQAINIATGPIVPILMMTGRENIVTKNSIYTIFVFMISTVVLTHYYGAYGSGAGFLIASMMSNYLNFRNLNLLHKDKV